MDRSYSFIAEIKSEELGGAYVEIPFNVEQAFGKKRVKVRALIDGQPYRGSLVRMGGECHILGVLKEIRQAIGKGPGDEVQVTLEEDTQPRVVEVPEDFQVALDASPEALRLFQELSYTHQREYVRWILEARREETRVQRIRKAVEMLVGGEKRKD